MAELATGDSRWAWPVEIYTLGGFHLLLRGQPLRSRTKPPRRSLELLKALIALGGRDVPSARLAELVWPDADGDRATQAFTTTLHRLRRLLGRECLPLSNGCLSLEASRVYVDLWEFETAVAAARQSSEESAQAADESKVARAVSLYRGPFLEGEFDLPEILACRERIHAVFLGAVREHCHGLAEAGRHGDAIRLLQRAVESDVYAEELYQQMMRCQAATGNVAEAIGTYQRLRQVLKAGFDIAPSAESEAIYRGLLALPRSTSPERVELSPRAEAPEPRAPAAQSLLSALWSEGERRQGTVLVGRLHGFSALAGVLDAEELRALMSEVHGELVRLCSSHGGRLEHFIGERLLVLFGAPEAHDDDAARAVRMAAELRTAVRGVSAARGLEGAHAFGLACGIDTGVLVVSAAAGEGFSSAGEPIGRASRLAERAMPDEILVGPETQRQIAALFLTEALEEPEDGVAVGVASFRVRGTTGYATRFEAGAPGGYTPFTGRERDLGVLQDCLERAVAGRGQFVTIAGEAGIGKSRLLYELRHRNERARVHVLEGRCQSSGARTPYLPFIAALRETVGLSAADPPERRCAAVVRTILGIDHALEAQLPFLLHLFSVPDPAYPLPANLQAEELRRAYEEALTALIASCARHRPAAIFLEDWHWVDDASEGALRYLLGCLGAWPLLVVVLYRPQYRADWGFLGEHTPLVLKPLESEEILAIARHNLGARQFSPDLSQAIRERAGGNPFFAEEICITLGQQGQVRMTDGIAELVIPASEMSIPTTVEAAIRSRVDRLDSDALTALRLASVIGREFPVRILESTYSGAASLETCLEQLRAHAFVYQERVVPEPQYLFKHVLTQVAVYESMLRHHRRFLHGHVGRAIEQTYADRVEEHLSELARHYSEAELWEKAVEFSWRAARRARGLTRYDETVRFLREALADLDRVPGRAQRNAQRFDLHYDLYDALCNAGQLPEAMEVCAGAEGIAREMDDRSRLGTAELMTGTVHILLGENENSRPYMSQALAHFQGTGETWKLIDTKWLLGVTYDDGGRWKEAESYLREALLEMEALGATTRYADSIQAIPYVISCAHLCCNLSMQSRIDEARMLCRKGFGPAQALASNSLTKVTYCVWCSRHLALTGEDPADVRTRIEEAIAQTEAGTGAFLRYMAYLAKATAWTGWDDYETVREFSRKCLEVMGYPRRMIFLAHVHYYLALSSLELGDLKTAWSAYEQGLELVPLTPAWHVGRYEFLKGRLLGAQSRPDFPEALAAFERSILADESQGAVVPAAQTRYWMAVVLARGGEIEHARAMLGDLRKRFGSWGVRAWEMRCARALEYPG
jgi:DNA-binding SARP family transcriptional activator/class 3 adenylate cyclase